MNVCHGFQADVAVASESRKAERFAIGSWSVNPAALVQRANPALDLHQLRLVRWHLPQPQLEHQNGPQPEAHDRVCRCCSPPAFHESCPDSGTGWICHRPARCLQTWGATVPRTSSVAVRRSQPSYDPSGVSAPRVRQPCEAGTSCDSGGRYLNPVGKLAANSISSWSSNGGLDSMLCAIVIRSTLTRMSIGR